MKEKWPILFHGDKSSYENFRALIKDFELSRVSHVGLVSLNRILADMPKLEDHGFFATYRGDRIAISSPYLPPSVVLSSVIEGGCRNRNLDTCAILAMWGEREYYYPGRAATILIVPQYRAHYFVDMVKTSRPDYPRLSLSDMQEMNDWEGHYRGYAILTPVLTVVEGDL